MSSLQPRIKKLEHHFRKTQRTASMQFVSSNGKVVNEYLIPGEESFVFIDDLLDDAAASTMSKVQSVVTPPQTIDGGFFILEG